MARKRRKPTANQREYKRQINRLRRYQRRLEKRGYSFEKNIYDISMPKRITKKVLETLKKMNPYKQASYKKPSGEKVSGIKGRELERKEAALKGLRTKGIISEEEYWQRTIRKIEVETAEDFSADMLIINNFLGTINGLPAFFSSPINDLFNNLLSRYKPGEVAEALEQATDFMDLLRQSAYGQITSGDTIEMFATSLIDHLPLPKEEKEKNKIYKELMINIDNYNFIVEDDY